MIDILLDKFTHDLDMSGLGLQIVSGNDQVVQNIKQRLLSFEGEWFLDLSLGLPWTEEILTKHSDLSIVEALLKAQIEGTPGVAELVSFGVEVNESFERAVNVNFSVLLDGGTTETVELEIGG